MKRNRVIALVLIFTLLLSLPAFASENRASDQIGMHNMTVTALPGEIGIKASIYGMGRMNKIGCQSIYVYKEYGTGWLLVDRMRETYDDNMYSTNASAHMANYYFDSIAGVEYRVEITLFAENDEGRDTVSQTFYVTGKPGNS